MGTQDTDRRRISRLIELWGPPRGRFKQDGSKHLIWLDDNCDIVASVIRANQVTMVTLGEHKTDPKEFFYDPGATSTGFPLARFGRR